jgi:hypothetical protein
MPRPKNGYTNAAGQQIPATHDPINRYMDRGALMMWAHKRGTQGLPLYDRAVLDIGSLVHAMADLDLQGRPDREIEKVAHDAGLSRDDYDKAMRAFMQFRKWRIGCHVQPIALETSLVSETYQYGGTPDCIAVIDGKMSLVEFKTSAKPYPDHLVAMAAHAKLWNENHPDQPIEAFHWIGLPKDGSEFQHHAYADLSTQWEIFTLWLDAWRLEKGLTRKRTTKPATVVPAPKARLLAAAAPADPPHDPPKPRHTRKPKEAPIAAAPAITPSQAGAVLRAVPRTKPAVTPPPVQLVMTAIVPPRPVQLTMTEILRCLREVA